MYIQSEDSVQIIYKILPLTMNMDGTVNITVKKCILHANQEIEAINEFVANIPESKVSELLDVPPTPGLTRRQDIGMMIYTLLTQESIVSGIPVE